MARTTTFYSNRLARPLTRAVQFPFTLNSRGGELLPAGASFTLETWVRINAWTNPPTVFGQGINSEYEQFLLLSDTFIVKVVNDGQGVGQVQFYSYSGESLTSAALVPVQQWVHLRLSYDASGLEGVIYLNNAVVSQGPFATAQQRLTGLNLGHVWSHRLSSNLNGLLGETRVWPYVRSAAQNAASWQHPNAALPDLAQAAAAWDYEDPVPADPASWSGFADGSGHGHYLMASTNQYEGSQPSSTVPFAAPPRAPSAPWDYDPARIAADAAAWPNAGFHPEQDLTVHTGSGNVLLLVEPAGGPNATPCVLFSAHTYFEGRQDLPITGVGARTHLVIFQAASSHYVELMGWGNTSSGFGGLYDSMLFYNGVIQHFYGYQAYSASSVQEQAWNTWLVRGYAASQTQLALHTWLNGNYAEGVWDVNTGAGPLRIGTGHYSNVPDERRVARVLIWDRALSDEEIAQLKQWVQATYGLPS